MKRHLKFFVEKELFANENGPSTTNRRYYPKNATIRNHIYLATVRLRFSKIDQVNVEEKINQWKRGNPHDNFFFRKYSDAKDLADMEKSLKQGVDKNEVDTAEDVKTQKACRKNLLLVYQTAWQKRLLAKYGNELSLLDATYKTTRYSLPLFFLVVKSNVDYQVVGSFVVQDEDTESIMEALHILHNWCPEWSPRYFMVDNSNEEINAITSVFPGSIFKHNFKLRLHSVSLVSHFANQCKRTKLLKQKVFIFHFIRAVYIVE